jgi:tetratricopeptide (TPR) repeat protein
MTELGDSSESDDGGTTEVGKLTAEFFDLHRRGHTEKAISIAERALAILERRFPPDHPGVATGLYDLAFLHRDQGNYAKAEPLLVRALAIYEKALRSDNPVVVQCLTVLANLYRAHGKHEKSAPLLARVLASRDKILGPDRPDVVKELNELALTYRAIGDNTKAEPLLVRALASLEKTVGPDHPDVVEELKELARFYVSARNYAKAELLLMRVLAIHERTLGPDDPAVEGDLVVDLANLYERQENYAKAEPLVERALAIREKIVGPDGESLWPFLEHLAWIYQKQGKCAKAELQYIRELAILEKHRQGWTCFAAADILKKLASLSQESGDTAKALDYTRQAEQRVDEMIRRSIGGQIPKYAAELYNEWKARDANLTDAEIAQRMFSLRYPANDPNFAHRARLNGYLEGKFECQGLLDYCLAVLDIEGEITPKNDRVFREVTLFIETELGRYGLLPAKEEASSFVARWYAQVVDWH